MKEQFESHHRTDARKAYQAYLNDGEKTVLGLVGQYLHTTKSIDQAIREVEGAKDVWGQVLWLLNAIKRDEAPPAAANTTASLEDFLG